MKEKKNQQARNKRRFALDDKGFDLVCREKEKMEKQLGVKVSHTLAFRSVFARAINGGQ